MLVFDVSTHMLVTCNFMTCVTIIRIITYLLSNSTCYRQECDYFHNRILFVITHVFSSTKAVTIGTVVICD